MFAIIDSPSNLGLRPTGVEELPRALRDAGLTDALDARYAGQVTPAAEYDPNRDRETGLLNAPALREHTHALANAISDVTHRDEIPIVLAGDCSVILGALLAARPCGLLFVDGHVDFYQPDASPTGEVADMDLALATGRGPAILSAFAGAPLVADADVVAVGARDRAEREAHGSLDIRNTAITVFELDEIRARGVDAAIQKIRRPFWCHVDADVLDDAVMPAVDYRQPGGFTPGELIALLRAATRSGSLLGVSLAIYNPSLDPNRDAARLLVDILARGLKPAGA